MTTEIWCARLDTGGIVFKAYGTTVGHALLVLEQGFDNTGAGSSSLDRDINKVTYSRQLIGSCTRDGEVIFS